MIIQVSDIYQKEKKQELKNYFLIQPGERKPQTKKGLYEVAKHITEHWPCLALGDFKRDIFIYENGIYKFGTNQIKEYVQEILEEIYSIGFFNEILEQIKNRCTKDRAEIERNNKHLLNTSNGILDLDSGELKEHQPNKYYFFNQIPINYDPEAKWDVFFNFLTEILEPEQIDLAQELFGFCLYRQYFIKKAIIISGEKNTGKTTLVRILTAMLGPRNVSGVSLQEIGSRPFSIADLYNKYANICDDMSSEDVTNTGKFKMVTGQSPLTGEYKYGDRFPFVNYAKLIFACNKIPAVNDVDDEAYFDRWVLLNFKKTIPEEKRDPFLVNKLTEDEAVMSGVLNFAVHGLKRLLEIKKFSYDKEPEQTKQEMLQNSNPIASFVYNCLVRVDNEFSWVKKDELYDAYCNFCADKKLVRDSDDFFYKNIYKYAPFVKDGQMRLGEGRIRIYKNVKLLA